MTVANVKNNHVAPLGIGGVDIGPGKTARIERWDIVSRSHAVRVWGEAGLIDATVVDAPVAAIPSAPAPAGLPGLPSVSDDDAEDARKEEIIDILRDEYGIEKTKRTSLANLEQALADAQE